MIYHPKQVLEDVSGQLDYSHRSYSASSLADNLNSHQATITRSTDAPNIEPVASVATNQHTSTNIKLPRSAAVIPEHLNVIYDQLDWHGQDLDALIVSTKLTAPVLIGQLMELELLGVISVQGGRYLRV